MFCSSYLIFHIFSFPFKSKEPKLSTVEKIIAAKPEPSTTVFTYTGDNLTYDIPEHIAYIFSGDARTQKDAGSYNIALELKEEFDYVLIDCMPSLGMITIKLYDLVWSRKVKGYQIAEATGLSTATVSKLMQGKNIDVKLSTIDKLCNFFDCELSELLEYSKAE